MIQNLFDANSHGRAYLIDSNMVRYFYIKICATPGLTREAAEKYFQQSLEEDRGDHAVGLFLVVREARVDLRVLVVQPAPLRASRDRDGPRAELLRPDLDRDLGVRAQIVVPGGVRGRAALRRDDQVPVAVPGVDKGVGAAMPALRALRGQKEHVATGERALGDDAAILPEVGDEIVVEGHTDATSPRPA